MDAVLGSLVLGARGDRPQYGHYLSDEGLVREALLVTFLAAEKSDSRTCS